MRVIGVEAEEGEGKGEGKGAGKGEDAGDRGWKRNRARKARGCG